MDEWRSCTLQEGRAAGAERPPSQGEARGAELPPHQGKARGHTCPLSHLEAWALSARRCAQSVGRGRWGRQTDRQTERDRQCLWRRRSSGPMRLPFISRHCCRQRANCQLKGTSSGFQCAIGCESTFPKGALEPSLRGSLCARQLLCLMSQRWSFRTDGWCDGGREVLGSRMGGWSRLSRVCVFTVGGSGGDHCLRELCSCLHVGVVYADRFSCVFSCSGGQRFQPESGSLGPID